MIYNDLMTIPYDQTELVWLDDVHVIDCYDMCKKIPAWFKRPGENLCANGDCSS